MVFERRCWVVVRFAGLCLVDGDGFVFTSGWLLVRGVREGERGELGEAGSLLKVDGDFRRVCLSDFPICRSLVLERIRGFVGDL